VVASEDGGPFLTIDQLPQPWRSMMDALSVYDDHPARVWFKQIGNGVFEDDHAVRELPGPHPIYQFRRDELAAYVWESGGRWFVRPWQRMRGLVSQAVVPVTDEALDELTRPSRRWWRFWG
jgi:hypothetical protein